MKLKIGIITSTFLPSIGGSQIGLHLSKSLNLLGHKIIIFVPFKTFIKLKRKIDFRLYSFYTTTKIFGIYYKNSKTALLLIRFYFNLINIFFKIDFWFANLAYPSSNVKSIISI